MKLLSKDQRDRQIRLSKKRHHHNIRRKCKLNTPQRKHESLQKEIQKLKEQYPKIETYAYKRNFIINAPKILSLNEGDKDEITQFFQCLRYIISAPSLGGKVEFTTIERLSPKCAILLASEVHRWKLIKRKQLKPIDSHKWDLKVKKLLSDIGFFEIVSVPYPTRIEKGKDTKETEEQFIKLHTDQENNFPNLYHHVQNTVYEIAHLMDSNILLNGGISEAITNVLNWAYDDSKQQEHPNIKHRWWFFASYNVKTGIVTFVVYDHGVGIPNTVPAQGWWESIKQYMDKKEIYNYSDEKIIEAVMNAPRSSSKMNHRGKGLIDMKRVLENYDYGNLSIYSRKGEYHINNNQIEHSDLLPYPIGGTLISWQVRT